MSFDVHKWNKRRYLAEAGLLESTADLAAKAINKAIDSVDDSILPEDLGKAIAIIVKDGYQDELRKRFMDALHAELGINESLNEAETLDIKKIDFEYTENEDLFRKARVYYKDGSMDSFFGAQFDKFLNDLGINQKFNTSDETDKKIFSALKGKDIKLTFSEKDVS
jgi:hypothetical protein